MHFTQNREKGFNYAEADGMVVGACVVKKSLNLITSSNSMQQSNFKTLIGYYHLLLIAQKPRQRNKEQPVSWWRNLLKNQSKTTIFVLIFERIQSFRCNFSILWIFFPQRSKRVAQYALFKTELKNNCILLLIIKKLFCFSFVPHIIYCPVF